MSNDWSGRGLNPSKHPLFDFTGVEEPFIYLTPLPPSPLFDRVCELVTETEQTRLTTGKWYSLMASLATLDSACARVWGSESCDPMPRELPSSEDAPRYSLFDEGQALKQVQARADLAEHLAALVRLHAQAWDTAVTARRLMQDLARDATEMRLAADFTAALAATERDGDPLPF
jgi:hypothetical protein